MPENHKIISAIISFVVALVVVVCVVVAYQYGYKNGLSKTSLSKTQNMPLESRLVLGTVEKISGQQITLKDFRKVPIAISADQSARMIIVVDQNTIVERLVQKDSATINKEIAAFTEKVQKLQAQGAQGTTTPLTPPEPFTREKLTLGDIKVGDTLAAFASEDIAKLTSFTATKIDIQVAPIKTPAVPKKQ